MALSDTALRRLRAREKAFQIADGGGLFIEVMPGGKKVWRLRYWLRGTQEKVTIGSYPAISLTEARGLREKFKGMVEHGVSPMQAKRAKKRARSLPDKLEEFAKVWLANVVEKTNSQPRTIRRALEKDILPDLGSKRLDEITTADVLTVTERIKARGSDQMTLVTRIRRTLSANCRAAYL